MSEQDQGFTTGSGAYGFRVPFRMAPRSLLDLPEPSHDLEVEDGIRVWLAAVEPSGPLRDALRLSIRGEGYESESSAHEAGERWRDIVCRGLARLHLAADFEERASGVGGLTEVGEQWYAEQLGHPVKSDVPGVTTFRSDPGLKFVLTRADGCRRPSPQQSASVFDAAASMDSSRLTPVERLAFDLYSGSFFQPSADARLLMLTMAIETLLDLQPRSPATQAHVQALIDATAAADLPTSERNSLSSSLSWLLDESIGQAGRKLARGLEPRTYADLKPSLFFTKCYEIRSALVHGRVPRPDRAEVDLMAAQLEMFVGHLLSGDLLTTFDA
jgi:hypothetical protein